MKLYICSCYNKKSMSPKGRLIVIEGTDGTGKTTQLKLLVDYLKKNRINFQTFDFPQYEKTFFGRFAGRFLNGEFGHFSRINPYLAMFPFAGDRWQVKNDLWNALNSGKIVLCNRYSSSDIYQAVKVKQNQRPSFLRWADQLEHEVFGIPRPDLVFVLYIPYYIAQNLIAKKAKRKYLNGKDKDQYEENLNYLKKVEELYLSMIKKNNNWIKINCFVKNHLLTPQQVHQKILYYLGLKGLLKFDKKQNYRYNQNKLI